MAEWEIGLLFPKANKTEIQRTKFLLQQYKQMKMLMEDFENHQQDMQQVAIDGEAARRINQDDLHADKTANAAILTEKQRQVYEQYQFITSTLERASRLIKDDDEKSAVHYRFMEGYCMSDTILFFRRKMSDSTIKRKVKDGTRNIADTLRLWDFFREEELWTAFL